MFWKFGMWISRKRYLCQQLMLANLALFIQKKSLRIFLFYNYVAVPFPHAELNRWQNNFPPCFSSSGSPVACFDKTLVMISCIRPPFWEFFFQGFQILLGDFNPQTSNILHSYITFSHIVRYQWNFFCILSVRLRVLGGRTPQKTFVILGCIFNFFLHKIMTISERKSW